MSDGHHVCLGRKCHSLKMLWWNPVAAVSIEAYCYLIERGRNFLFSLFRMGLEEGTTGNILVKFCAQMLENLSSRANRDFWLQQLRASL